MHARHRGPGNGYRSNAVGMVGVATASRISPDRSSIRGHAFYNSEYRNYNRGGYGRGKGRQFQQPQPPPRKGDIFMEAGKLAAEYLVSKGLLPPNALTGKWQNDSLKNQVEDFQSIRSRDGDGLPLSVDGRASALSRLGNSVADIGSGKRRYIDEYSLTGSRNYMGERRRSGSFKSYGTEGKRELGRSGSWSRGTRDSPDTEVYDDTSSGRKDEQQAGKEGGSGLQNTPSSEDPPVIDKKGHTESAGERNNSTSDADAHENSFSSDTKKILFPEADAQPAKEYGNMEMSDAEGGKVNDQNNNDELEKQSTKEDIAVEPSVEEENQEAENGSELLKLSQFVNVPTKTRSSVTANSFFHDRGPVSERKDIHETGHSKESIADPQDVPVDGSSISESSNASHNSKNMDSDLKNVPATEKEKWLAYSNGQGNSIDPMTISEKSLMQEQVENDGLSIFGRASSVFMERGEKRALNSDDSWDAAKRPREWTPSINARTDSCLNLSDSMEKPQNSEEPTTSNFDEEPDTKRLFDMSLFPIGNIACVNYAEEKKLFPGSFKTCDLNLMEASEVKENRDAELIHVFPSITESGKQAMSVDVDLTMSNNGNPTDKYGKSGNHGKDIEVIDLENDSIRGDKAFGGSEQRAESAFTGLDGFPHNANNNNEIPDVQDGYGLMISELLGNDIPNCSSVPPDMNSLHNDIGLHNGEGILGDDDSIYMTLGEIPISFLRGWEQPTQEYGKPF